VPGEASKQSCLFDLLRCVRRTARGKRNPAAKKNTAAPQCAQAVFLLAENNRINQDVALGNWIASVTADVVANGREALERWNVFLRYILMDCMMPEMEVKSNKKTPRRRAPKSEGHRRATSSP